MGKESTSISSRYTVYNPDPREFNKNKSATTRRGGGASKTIKSEGFGEYGEIERTRTECYRPN